MKIVCKYFNLFTMVTFEISNVYGAIIIDTRRNKTDGKFPVKYRITHERMQIYFKSGFDLTVDDWKNLSKSRDNELKQIRNQLKAGFKRIENAVESITLEHDYTHERLKTLLKHGKGQKVFDLFQQRINELEKNGQIGTSLIYTNAQRFIYNYAPNLQLSNITLSWLTSFERYALDEKKLRKPTFYIYARCLRAIFNLAIHNGIIKSALYPFRKNRNERNKYKINKGSGRRVYLTKSQIKSIIDYKAPTPSIERSRDFFILQYYFAGLNFKDLLLLKWSSIVDVPSPENDKVYFKELHYIREKTKDTIDDEIQVIKLPIIPRAWELIEKHGSINKKGFIIPFMIDNPTPKDVRRIVTNKIRQVNKHLKRIGKELNIKGLSTNVSRHSFATIQSNEGAPTAFLKESFGHKSLKTTENYMQGFEPDKKRKYFDNL